MSRNRHPVQSVVRSALINSGLSNTTPQGQSLDIAGLLLECRIPLALSPWSFRTVGASPASPSERTSTPSRPSSCWRSNEELMTATTNWRDSLGQKTQTGRTACAHRPRSEGSLSQTTSGQATVQHPLLVFFPCSPRAFPSQGLACARSYE